MQKIEGRRTTLAGTVALVGALVLGWTGTSAGEQPTAPAEGAAGDAAGGPRLEFSVSEHDFGHAVSGNPLKTTFAFKNAGDGVLVIEKVKGG
jgi:hypothetical protein